MGYTDKNIGRSELKEQPSKPFIYKLKDKSVKEKHIDDNAVTTPKIKDKSVTPEKRSDNFDNEVIKPYVNAVDNKYGNITNQLDSKFDDITDELYSMVASLQVGGIALSGKFGNRTDIGIHQKALTNMIGRLWDELETITGKTYMDFSLTVQPTFIAKEGTGTITVTADCLESISDFDSIRFYINEELKAESHDVSVYTQSFNIEEDGEYTIKAVGVIFNKTITKTQTISKATPFYMGGGRNYQDIMTEEYRKDIEGTLEGDYDLVVKQDGQHMFIIIPASRQSEFRRAMLVPDYDMNGFEIPLDKIEENQNYVVYKSKAENGYLAGTYNIDININS